MKVEVASQQAGQMLQAIRMAASFAASERDYLVGGLFGMGAQQVTGTIAETLNLLLAGLDYVEAQLHQQLQTPLQHGKRALRLAHYATLAGDLDAIGDSIEVARANFSQVYSRYEDHPFLRILCFCTVGILRGLQGERDRMSYHFREALSELEAFRFLKVSAAMSRLTALDGATQFVRADLELQATEKVDALPIPEWGIDLAALHATLQEVGVVQISAARSINGLDAEMTPMVSIFSF